MPVMPVCMHTHIVEMFFRILVPHQSMHPFGGRLVDRPEGRHRVALLTRSGLRLVPFTESGSCLR
jgi:hypothetical protein